MIFGREKELHRQIVETGKKLCERRLVAASSGNVSGRLAGTEILITATGSSLGSLKEEDIIRVDYKDENDIRRKPLSTEFPLHRLIYESLPGAKVVVHCHPPLTNGYFAVYQELKNLTFESKLYLGNIPVVSQETPSITRPEKVVEALNANNLAVIKNHGVVCVAEQFKKGLDLIETLEEAVKVTATARLFDKSILDSLDQALKSDLTKPDAYAMFSREHIQAIVDLVNHDEFILRKGTEMDLTLKLAIAMDGSDNVYRFNFEKGRITGLDAGADAPFVISAPSAVWEQVFLGKVDPFVATTQGRMKLKGELGKLSRWYVPFSRLFELFRQVRIK